MRRGLWREMAHPLEKPSPRSVDGPEDISPRGWKRILLDTWKDSADDNLPLVSAGVAFYAFLAFVPLLTAFVLSYGLVAEPASVVSQMQTLTSIMPSETASLIGDQLRGMTETSGTKTGFALILALAVALYGASKGAGSIMIALNIVFAVEETRTFIRRTIMALAMTAGAVIVLFLAILAVSALNFLEAIAPDLGGFLHLIIKAGFFLVAAAAVVLLLAAIYRYGPNRPEAKWKWITPGSGAASFLWLAATAGFGLYVSNFGNYNATYGSLGAVIMFLSWLYLTFYVVLMGAELNAILEIEVARHEAFERRSAPSAAARPLAAGAVAASPSPAKVAARITMLSVLLALLGKSRRPTLVR
ncbi:MAG: YihY/virulence factor BrkB family protein [Allosphingosinicella sp.]